MLNYIEHARLEMERANVHPDTAKRVIDLMRQLMAELGSNRPAGLIAGYAAPLLKGEPLSPLTGEQSEWFRREDGLLLNNRCERVIKYPDGKVLDMEGIVFFDGGSYTYGPGSHREVIFPYMPFTEIVDTRYKLEMLDVTPQPKMLENKNG